MRQFYMAYKDREDEIIQSGIGQLETAYKKIPFRKQVQKDMKELQEMHIIAREGTNRRGRWIIVKENK